MDSTELPLGHPVVDGTAAASASSGCPYNRTVHAWQSFSGQQLHNLQHASSVVQVALRQRRLPALDDFPPEVLETLILSWAIANAVLIMLVPKTRRIVLSTLESVVTILLLLALIGLVLAMPVGVAYLSYKGVAIVGTSLAQRFPQLGALAQQASQAVRDRLPIGGVAP